MRTPDVQHETIRIVASVTNEERYISVSGLAKLRVRWLFRNFSILGFSVLNGQQRQLIAQAWNAGLSVDLIESVGLIGTIEGFTPKLYQPSVPVARSGRPGVRFGLSSGLGIFAMWIAMGVVLLGCAVYLVPKHVLGRQSRVTSVAAKNVSSTIVSGISGESERGPASEASSIALLQSSDAGAYVESSLEVKAPPSPDAATPKIQRKPEVMIRVSVDNEGRVQALHILRGDQKTKSAALYAAKHWHFQPCSDSAGCEHLLKFTDYGDASSVQIID